jgi:drug/metabolite transporter (DMT)-like permease
VTLAPPSGGPGGAKGGDRRGEHRRAGGWASLPVDWLVFGLLSFCWGSSYLFIKIGVDAGLEPFTLVTLRLFVGLLLLWTVALAAREPLPNSRRMWAHLFVMGLLSIALPFSLITAAERSVDSALAAILTAAVPLFAIPVAALALRDEPISRPKLGGVLIGFIGVALLVGLDPAAMGSGELGSKAALIGAAASYAIGATYARRFASGLRPVVAAVLQVTLASLITAALAFTFEKPLDSPLTTGAVVAVLWLGALGSGVAYLAFFRLLGAWGAGRTLLVNYVLPLWGIALGASVLGEQIDLSVLTGTALIMGGIVLANTRLPPLLNRASS